jgi:outer membrane protein OmpA-like peptidoglycan-associated protein
MTTMRKITALAALPLVALAACTPASAEPVTAEPYRPLSDEARAACAEVFARTVPDAADKLVIVVDQTDSNAGQPLPDELREDLTKASLADGSLTVIAVDGTGAAPTILADEVALSTEGARDRPSVDALAANMASCVQDVYLHDAHPQAAGTDLHRAMAIAGEVATADTTVWLLSDMLPNVGPLALDDGLIWLPGTDAGTLAAQIAPIDLHGATLKIHGVANTSTALQAADRTWTLDWARALCEGWGATGCADIHLSPANAVHLASGLPDDPLPTFPDSGSTVIVTEEWWSITTEETWSYTTTTETPTCTFTVPASLTFIAETDELLPDVDIAQVLSEPLAMLLAGGTVSIVGHTAKPSRVPDAEVTGMALSQARADRIAMWFLTQGVAPEQVEMAIGVGDTEPLGAYRDAAGNQIPQLAAAERRVELIVTGGGTCQ